MLPRSSTGIQLRKAVVSFRDQAVMAKANRKLERKSKEAMQQVEEERRHADQYKEQVCPLFCGDCC